MIQPSAFRLSPADLAGERGVPPPATPPKGTRSTGKTWADPPGGFARGRVLVVLSCTDAIGDLDRDFCRLYHRWICTGTLGWRHDLLLGSAAQWCRRLRGIVARGPRA